MRLPNPLIPGFSPDPSVVRVGGDYYLVTSTFEYLPGIPVYHSSDLVSWELVGHVLTRLEQFDPSEATTGGGIWAPTIRWRDGLFSVIVAAAGTGTRIYTATDPAGPWSDGTLLAGLDGIDPDLAWDDDGSCYVTFSGLVLSGPEIGTHLGIQQVRVNESTGELLEAPRNLWSGTGLMFPEAPHLYRIGEWWYLMIAEGGTERGHSVSIARAKTPDGPFVGCPANPVLSAKGTANPVQNTGHGDLVLAPDGSWSMVLLGVRVRGLTRGFSALGRETFGTHVEWVDGWPVVEAVQLSGDNEPEFSDDFDASDLGLEWIAVRRSPCAIAHLAHGTLVLRGEGQTMADQLPTFVGRRQRRHEARISTVVVDPSAGVGGLSVRYDEEHYYSVEVGDGTVTGRACVASLLSEVQRPLPAGPVELILEMRPVVARYAMSGEVLASRMSCDMIALAAIDSGGVRHDVATFDGRFLSSESTCSFTGRVAGLYCVSGELAFESFSETDLAR